MCWHAAGSAFSPQASSHGPQLCSEGFPDHPFFPSLQGIARHWLWGVRRAVLIYSFDFNPDVSAELSSISQSWVEHP